MRGALAILLLGGCNVIFGLDPTTLGGDGAVGVGDARRDGGGVIDGPARNCTPVGHDEDGDGIDDACDRCPYIASVAGDPDSDGDGVGDDCDPHPGSPDHFVLFDPLITPDTRYTAYRGIWSADVAGLHQSGVEDAKPTLALLADTTAGDAVVDVGVTIDDLSPDVPAQELSLWTDAVGGDATNQPDGIQAELARGVPPTIELGIWQSQIDTIGPSMQTVGTYAVGDRWRLRVERATTEVIETAIYLALGSATTVEIADASHTSGAIGLETFGTAITVEYIAVIVPGP